MVVGDMFSIVNSAERPRKCVCGTVSARFNARRLRGQPRPGATSPSACAVGEGCAASSRRRAERSAGSGSQRGLQGGQDIHSELHVAMDT